MPKWDFRCPACGDVMEIEFASVAERDECLPFETTCGNHDVTVTLELLPSAPNFKLVGKGFHCNDYPKR